MGAGDERGAARRRPRWMTLFAVVMLLLGGRMLLTSLSDLHRVVTHKPEVLQLDGSLDAQQEVLLRAQVVLSNALYQHRPVTLTLHALARLVLGLVYLFAVAALFSGDRRGRQVSLLAGWVGVAVCVANALFVGVVVRGMLPWLLPMLSAGFAQDAARAGRPPLDADAVELQSNLFLHEVPMVITALGVLWSLLLIAYFSGRSVRLFYNQRDWVNHD
jgi:hypothetical protein